MAETAISTPKMERTLIKPDGSSVVETTSWEKIGPQEAYDLLVINTSNRPLRATGLKNLTELMRNGQYDFLNVDPIVTSWDNILMNGQHRLTAIFESGVTGKFLVIRNADPKMYPALDRAGGAGVRTTADIYSKMVGTKTDDTLEGGIKKSSLDKTVVAIAMAVLRSGLDSLPNEWRNNNDRQAEFTHQISPVILSVLQHYPVTKNTKTKTSIFSVPVAAAFVNAAKRYKVERVAPLLKKLKSQEWGKGAGGEPDPMCLLRDLILETKRKAPGSRNSVKDNEIYNYAVSAIRAGLSHPKHWVHRLLASNRNFGEAAEWETRIRQNAPAN